MDSNETVFSNATTWRETDPADWWAVLIASSILTLHSIIWLIATFGGIGTIKDLLCDLACSAACDGWRNVDYVTESAIFFSYWTFLPFITVTYCGISVIDGILGICGIVLEHVPTMQTTMIFTIIYLILAILLLIFFSFISCCYALCRCCIETTVEEVNDRLNEETGEMKNMNTTGSAKPDEPEEEKEKQNYFCNFFQHFAIPILVYIILYSVILNRGWKFAYGQE